MFSICSAAGQPNPNSNPNPCSVYIAPWASLDNVRFRVHVDVKVKIVVMVSVTVKVVVMVSFTVKVVLKVVLKVMITVEHSEKSAEDSNKYLGLGIRRNSDMA